MLPADAHDSPPAAAASPQHQQPLAQQPKSASTCISPTASQISEQHQRLFTAIPVPTDSCDDSPPTLADIPGDCCQPQSEQTESASPYSSPFTATRASEYPQQPHIQQMGTFATGSTSPPATDIFNCQHQPHAARLKLHSAPPSGIAAVGTAGVQQAFAEQAESASTSGPPPGGADVTGDQQSDTESVRFSRKAQALHESTSIMNRH